MNEAGEGSGSLPGRTIELQIVDFNVEGAGVGRWEGRVVFVPGVVIGERVRVRVVAERRRRLDAVPLEVIEPSARRRPASCAQQGRCGGCPLMVVDEETGLDWKVQHLARQLRRLAGVDLPIDPVVASPSPLEYRSRVRLALARRGGRWRAGYRPRGRGAAVVAVDRCHLLAPGGWEVVESLLARMDERHPASGEGPTHLELRGSLAAGRWLAVWHSTPAAAPQLRRASRRALAAGEPLAGAAQVDGAGRGKGRVVWQEGRCELTERIGGVEFPLGIQGFVQVNPAAAGKLYRLAGRALRDEAGEAPRSLLDLYCGAGLIALHGAGPASRVVGVELDPAGARAARRAARDQGFADADFLTGDAEAAAAGLADAGKRFEALAVNPPRAGIGKSIPALARRLGVRRVVMVSCHPATAARDLARFADFGYRAVAVAAVDMFPQTPHLEVVVTLESEPRG
ncbi:MAG: TRAM domain-containing protein [Acidobacteriota bacterium]|nr:TRAM domain-containing protein [Acidobacteriota bacterium]MDQ7086633.1 TRAM domain-containing protein [Acidobacteriota bacterium]